MDPETFAQQVTDSLGPLWWNQKVESVIASNRIILVFAVLALFVVVVGLAVGVRLWRRRDIRGEDLVFGSLMFGFLPLLIAVIGLLTALTNLSTPELVVWKELVYDVSQVLQ